MEQKVTIEIFQKSIKEYTSILKKSYLEYIEKADDKQYAEKYYQDLLFVNNEMVPYASVLFNELKFTFGHYQRLFGIDEAYEKTIDLLPRIRKISKNLLLTAKRYEAGQNSEPISDWYLEQIQKNDFSLSDLILLEEKVLASTNENVIGALAIHLSGQLLYKEYHSTSTEDQSEKGQFTLNERLLALSILLESLGFKQGMNEDRTTLAALYHLIMDKNFNETVKVKNTNIYKSLGSLPKVVNDPSKLKIYLQNIRPFFEKTNMTAAIESIDQLIKSCQ